MLNLRRIIYRYSPYSADVKIAGFPAFLFIFSINHLGRSGTGRARQISAHHPVGQRGAYARPTAIL